MPPLPQPGGQQRDQTKFIVFENFDKMNTQSARQGLSEKELAWLENLQPIAPNKYLTVPAVGAAIHTVNETFVSFFYAAINGVDYIIGFTTAGSAYAINVATGLTNNFAPDGTFSTAPDVTTWEASRILINDSVAGYCTWDGTTFYRQGNVSPNINVTDGGIYSTPPVVTITGGSGTGATGVATLTGTAVTSVQLTNAGIGYLAGDTLTVNFTAVVGSGATAVTTMSLSSVIGVAVNSPGLFRYSTYPAPTVAVAFSGGGGSGAAGYANIEFTPSGSGVSSVVVTAGGSGYSSPPTCTVDGIILNFSGAYAPSFTTVLSNQTVTGITLTAGGSGYTSDPLVVITGGGPYVQATAIAGINAGGAVNALQLTGTGLYPAGAVTGVLIETTSATAAAEAHVWPFVPNGTTLAVFQGRVWLNGLNTLTGEYNILQWTGTGASYGDSGYDDFLAADASGSLIVSDADLIHSITALRSLDNYLFVMGDQSVKQIGNISLDSAGLVTLFTILTLSSDQGTIYPRSCISLNRVFLFANQNGVYGVFGSTVQKLSDDMDGIWEKVDFTQSPQGALFDLYAIHHAAFLIRYVDPIEGERSIMLAFNGKKWWVVSQGNSLTTICTTAALASGVISLYGSSGNDVTPLLASPTTPVNFKIQTALTHHGNAVQGKKVIRAGFTSQVGANSSVTMTVDTEGGQGTALTMDVETGVSLVGGSIDANSTPIGASGIFLGVTITGTLAGFTLTNLIEEYQETSLWKGA